MTTHIKAVHMAPWVVSIATGLLLATCGDADSGQHAGQKATVDANDDATTAQDSTANSDTTTTDSGHAPARSDATVADIAVIPCSVQFDKKCRPACDVFNDVDCCLAVPGCQWEADQCICGPAP